MKDDKISKFGAVIRAYRKKAGLSLYSLTKLMNASPSAIYRMERVSCFVNHYHVTQLEKILRDKGINLDQNIRILADLHNGQISLIRAGVSEEQRLLLATLANKRLSAAHCQAITNFVEQLK